MSSPNITPQKQARERGRQNWQIYAQAALPKVIIMLSIVLFIWGIVVAMLLADRDIHAVVANCALVVKWGAITCTCVLVFALVRFFTR